MVLKQVKIRSIADGTAGLNLDEYTQYFYYRYLELLCGTRESYPWMKNRSGGHGSTSPAVCQLMTCVAWETNMLSEMWYFDAKPEQPSRVPSTPKVICARWDGSRADATPQIRITALMQSPTLKSLCPPPPRNAYTHSPARTQTH